MKKLTYLLLLLPLFLFNACTDDTPSSLTGTKWVYAISGQEAWDMMGTGETMPAGANISFNITLNFTSATSVTIDSNASITMNGETIPYNDSTTATYTYDATKGVVAFTVDGSVETGTIVGKKLTFVSDGKTMVFEKK